MVKINIDKLICDALICIIFFFIDHVLSFQLTLVIYVQLLAISTILHMVIKPLIHLYALSIAQICMYHIPYQYKFLIIKINANSAWFRQSSILWSFKNIYRQYFFSQSNGPPPGYFHKYTFKRMTKNTENGPSKFLLVFFSSRL